MTKADMFTIMAAIYLAPRTSSGIALALGIIFIIASGLERRKK